MRPGPTVYTGIPFDAWREELSNIDLKVLRMVDDVNRKKKGWRSYDYGSNGDTIEILLGQGYLTKVRVGKVIGYDVLELTPKGRMALRYH